MKAVWGLSMYYVDLDPLRVGCGLQKLLKRVVLSRQMDFKAYPKGPRTQIVGF